MNFKEELQNRQNYINEVLDRFLPEVSGKQKTVLDAMRYSVTIGGKRLRPIMMLEVFRCFAGQENESKIAPFLAAMEMLHTYSLVHDDLPDMDNDMYRRGQLTTHAKYGSAMAILAGDALLNFAFETAGQAFTEESAPEGMEWNLRVAKALQVFGRKAGIFGMIGGQVVDVEKTGQPLSEEEIGFIYKLKTCALLEASMMIGAILGGAGADMLAEVEQMAYHIGMAFQIQDDILDMTGDEAKLGKPLHSDEKNQKTTYVTLHGLEAAKAKVKELSEKAVETAKKIHGTEFLQELIDYLIVREN
ncbi:MAG: polyprenyl synthetase family protein [Lachnospiraceae bacterium]|nr:polyprenyl synthetase family protein [Lachnospiraceae bacterium]